MVEEDQGAVLLECKYAAFCRIYIYSRWKCIVKQVLIWFASFFGGLNLQNKPAANETLLVVNFQ